MDRSNELELRKIGNSMVLILPKELLAKLGLEQGDSVTVTETPNGSWVSVELALRGKVDADGLSRWIRDNWPRDRKP